MEPENAPGIDAWFRRVGGAGSRVFSADVRFSRPGPWALSFMDLDGYFYDFGLRDVSSPRPEARSASTAAGAGSSAAATWLVAAAGLAVTAGVALSVRRWQGS